MMKTKNEAFRLHITCLQYRKWVECFLIGKCPNCGFSSFDETTIGGIESGELDLRNRRRCVSCGIACEPLSSILFSMRELIGETVR